MSVFAIAIKRPPSAYDFTTFTEVDPSSDLTVTTNTIVADTMRRDVSAGVYKDFGENFFSGDFTFEWDFNFQGEVGSYGACSIFALTPVFALTRDNRDTSNTGIDVYISINTGDVIQTFLRDWVTDSADQTDTAYTVPQRFWYTLTRVSSTITLKIYTDANRSVLYDTLSISNGAAPAYRYLYPLSSFDSSFAPTDLLTGTISDLIYTP